MTILFAKTVRNARFCVGTLIRRSELIAVPENEIEPIDRPVGIKVAGAPSGDKCKFVGVPRNPTDPRGDPDATIGRARTQTSLAEDTRHIQVNNDIIVGASTVFPRLTPLAANRVDSLFAISRQEERTEQDDDHHISAGIPIFPYLL